MFRRQHWMTTPNFRRLTMSDTPIWVRTFRAQNRYLS
jgi:hypothetical protein